MVTDLNNDTEQNPLSEKRVSKRTVNFLGKEKQGDKRMSNRGRARTHRAPSEFDQRVLDVRRVARVIAGGRRFSFSVTLAAGDHKGRIGVGLGKGADTTLAMDKALKQAKRLMIKVTLSKTRSILRSVNTKYSSAQIYLKPAPRRGLVAGSALRVILNLAGITDVNAKVLSRSKNKLNIARATIQALKKLS